MKDVSAEGLFAPHCKGCKGKPQRYSVRSFSSAQNVILRHTVLKVTMFVLLLCQLNVQPVAARGKNSPEASPLPAATAMPATPAASEHSSTTTPAGSVSGASGAVSANTAENAAPAGQAAVIIPPAPVPGSVLSSRTTSYDMALQLDPVARKLKGEQRITWINRSPEPIQEVQLHLYWNAFKNDRSSFFAGLRGRGMRFQRGENRDADWGYIDLQSFRQQGQELVGGLSFLQPDDGNLEDQTVARIPLAAPVLPGETVVFETRFEARVPAIIARAGVKGEFFLMGQFFPKLGVLEYPGVRYATAVGWNCHQYHSRSEYYSDFGNYDVRITLPSRFIVGATGQQQSVKDQGNGTSTHHYVQNDVIDFVWTAWPDFQEHLVRFEAEGLSPVSVRFLFPEEYRRATLKTVRATMVALESAGRRFFPYPHPTLTVVVPPFGADEAGGMEYPTFITTWGEVFPGNGFGTDGTTIHEFGHQYFQGMLASNEFEESWLDEGFTSYATDLMMQDGGYALQFEARPVGRLPILLPLTVQTSLWKRAILSVKFSSPMQTAAWKFRSGGDYGMNSYTRPSMTLEALGAQLGDEKMRQVMQVYTRRFAFKHPTAQDFFQTAQEVAGQPLDWFFQQFVFGNQRLDLAVAEVSTRLVKPGRGYFSAAGEAASLRTQARASEDEDEEDEDASASSASPTPAAAPESGKAGEQGPSAGTTQKRYRSEVVVENRETATFPTELLVVFEDGTELRETWDGSGGWKRFQYERNSKLVRAQLDPDGRMLMDRNPLNNGRQVEKNGLSATRLRYLVHQVFSVLYSSLMMLV